MTSASARTTSESKVIAFERAAPPVSGFEIPSADSRWGPIGSVPVVDVPHPAYPTPLYSASSGAAHSHPFTTSSDATFHHGRGRGWRGGRRGGGGGGGGWHRGGEKGRGGGRGGGGGYPYQYHQQQQQQQQQQQTYHDDNDGFDKPMETDSVDRHQGGWRGGGRGGGRGGARERYYGRGGAHTTQPSREPIPSRSYPWPPFPEPRRPPHASIPSHDPSLDVLHTHTPRDEPTDGMNGEAPLHTYKHDVETPAATAGVVEWNSKDVWATINLPGDMSIELPCTTIYESTVPCVDQPRTLSDTLQTQLLRAQERRGGGDLGAFQPPPTSTSEAKTQEGQQKESSVSLTEMLKVSTALEAEAVCIDLHTYDQIQNMKQAFDRIPSLLFLLARYVTSTNEGIGRLEFKQNRTAVKLLELTYIFNQILTNPSVGGEDALSLRSCLGRPIDGVSLLEERGEHHWTPWCKLAPIVALDLCAGPGGTVECLSNLYKWRAKITAVTLTGKDDMRWDRFNRHSDLSTVEAFYGTTPQHNQGDITDHVTLREVVRHMWRTSAGRMCDLVFADGGFSVRGNELNQEVASAALLLAQCTLGIACTRQGDSHATFVVKTFDICSLFTLKLIAFVMLFFERMSIGYGLEQSRRANSERYIMFMGRRHDQQWWPEYARHHHLIVNDTDLPLDYLIERLVRIKSHKKSSIPASLQSVFSHYHSARNSKSNGGSSNSSSSSNSTADDDHVGSGGGDERDETTGPKPGGPRTDTSSWMQMMTAADVRAGGDLFPIDLIPDSLVQFVHRANTMYAVRQSRYLAAMHQIVHAWTHDSVFMADLQRVLHSTAWLNRDTSHHTGRSVQPVNYDRDMPILVRLLNVSWAFRVDTETQHPSSMVQLCLDRWHWKSVQETVECLGKRVHFGHELCYHSVLVSDDDDAQALPLDVAVPSSDPRRDLVDGVPQLARRFIEDWLQVNPVYVSTKQQSVKASKKGGSAMKPTYYFAAFDDMTWSKAEFGFFVQVCNERVWVPLDTKAMTTPATTTSMAVDGKDDKEESERKQSSVKAPSIGRRIALAKGHTRYFHMRFRVPNDTILFVLRTECELTPSLPAKYGMAEPMFWCLDAVYLPGQAASLTAGVPFDDLVPVFFEHIRDERFLHWQKASGQRRMQELRVAHHAEGWTIFRPELEQTVAADSSAAS